MYLSPLYRFSPVKKFYEHYSKFLCENQHLYMKNDKNFFAVFTKKPKGDIMYLVNLLITGVKKAFFMILRVLKSSLYSDDQ